MINFSKFNSIISLTSYFTSDAKCMQAIVESRWGVGNEQDVICPYCGKHHCKMSKNGRFHCTECNKNFSCLVGTIFENTKLPLIKWFVAMYLISSHKKGVSSHQLRQEDSEYPNRIMVTNGYNERFHGRVVEVANNIANRICGLYNTFTDDYYTSYVIQ